MTSYGYDWQSPLYCDYLLEERAITLMDCKIGGAIVSYQNKVGTLTNGAHPGACNGQDVYSDLLITEKGQNVDKLDGAQTAPTLTMNNAGGGATDAG